MGAEMTENLSEIYPGDRGCSGEIWLIFALTVGDDYDKIYN